MVSVCIPRTFWSFLLAANINTLDNLPGDDAASCAQSYAASPPLPGDPLALRSKAFVRKRVLLLVSPFTSRLLGLRWRMEHIGGREIKRQKTSVGSSLGGDALLKRQLNGA